MHPIEWTLIIISSLGLLFGIGVLIRTLTTSFKENFRKILNSKATWLTALTILSCLLALSYQNFFYGFPAVPLLIAALAVLLISRRLMMATVSEKSIWISLFITLLLGIWSFSIYLLLVVILIPNYPTLHHYEGHSHGLYGMMLVGFAVWEMIFSITISLYTVIKETRKQRKED